MLNIISTYTIGKIFEYTVKKRFTQREYITFRCAGSKPFDILAISGGTIYFYLCKNIAEIKRLRREFIDFGYVVIRQSGKHIFVCLKDRVVIILFVKTLPDYRILNEIQTFHINKNFKLVSILNIKNEIFDQQNLEQCDKIGIVECKMSEYYDREQINELFPLLKIMGVLLLTIAIYKRTYINIQYHDEQGLSLGFDWK